MVSTRAELGRLCTVKKTGLCPHFEAVVLVDGVTADAAEMAKQAGLEVVSFAKVEAGTDFVVFPISNTPVSPILYAHTIFFCVA